jgi:hypothetical protein
MEALTTEIENLRRRRKSAWALVEEVAEPRPLSEVLRDIRTLDERAMALATGPITPESAAVLRAVQAARRARWAEAVAAFHAAPLPAFADTCRSCVTRLSVWDWSVNKPSGAAE